MVGDFFKMSFLHIHHYFKNCFTTDISRIFQYNMQYILNTQHFIVADNLHV